MIIYKYSLIEDVKMYLRNRKLKDFFEAEDIYIVDFGIVKYIKFLWDYFTGKIYLPQIETSFDITCYLMSSGNWGSYQLPNIVQFCPLEMDDLNMTTEELLEHEITHLIYEKDVQGMTHKQKEEFIEKELRFTKVR